MHSVSFSRARSSMTPISHYLVVGFLFHDQSPLLPAEKGGLRRADVSECVAVSFDFPLNFTMVMGSFT